MSRFAQKENLSAPPFWQKKSENQTSIQPIFFERRRGMAHAR
jgi:hypothetical protein